MLNHLKTFWALHATLIVAIGIAISQASNSYLTQHPKATAGGFFGALGWAVITLFMKSPTGGSNDKQS